MDLNKFGFVSAGALRMRIVLLLSTPKTPKQLRDLIKTQDSAVARSLGDLRREKIIKCLNPGVRKGKVFVLTKDGKEIRKRLYKEGF